MLSVLFGKVLFIGVVCGESHVAVFMDRIFLVAQFKLVR